MPHTASALRPFWLQGLNEISGYVDRPNWLNNLNGSEFKGDAGLAGWLSIETNFLITEDLDQEKFKLSPITGEDKGLLRSYAFDLCKFGTASMESMQGITQDDAVPRSTGWAIIRAYYASFFAAHALLRIFGISCTQLGALQVTNINKVGDQLGFGVNSIKGGFYCCKFDSATSQLDSFKLNAKNDGSHGSMWRIFNDLIVTLKSHINESNVLLNENKISVNNMLSQLSSNLTHGKYVNSANWLSSVRNHTNYKQLDGAWFPYKGYKKEYSDIYEITRKWIDKPTEINLISPQVNEFRSFVSTCTTIVSLYRELAIDMSSRCSNGVSFHKHLSLRYLRQIKVNDN